MTSVRLYYHPYQSMTKNYIIGDSEEKRLINTHKLHLELLCHMPNKFHNRTEAPVNLSQCLPNHQCLDCFEPSIHMVVAGNLSMQKLFRDNIQSVHILKLFSCLLDIQYISDLIYAWSLVLLWI